ncbi:uncharacterized protein V6R79_009005 [Siganus canaliculatus]
MDINVQSYNCRSLRLGQSAADKARRIVVDRLLEHCDILCLQETFLAKQDLEGLNSISDNFHGVGESTTDLSLGLKRGRSPGGVAIMWNKKLDSAINVIRLDVDWCIAVQLTQHDKDFIILNIYTPYECQLNEDNYVNKLAFISSYLQKECFTNIFIVGDMNADISDKSKGTAFFRASTLIVPEELVGDAESLLHPPSPTRHLRDIRGVEQLVTVTGQIKQIQSETEKNVTVTGVMEDESSENLQLLLQTGDVILINKESWEPYDQILEDTAVQVCVSLKENLVIAIKLPST